MHPSPPVCCCCCASPGLGAGEADIIISALAPLAESPSPAEAPAHPAVGVGAAVAPALEAAEDDVCMGTGEGVEEARTDELGEDEEAMIGGDVRTGGSRRAGKGSPGASGRLSSGFKCSGGRLGARPSSSLKQRLLPLLAFLHFCCFFLFCFATEKDEKSHKRWIEFTKSNTSYAQCIS